MVGVLLIVGVLVGVCEGVGVGVVPNVHPHSSIRVQNTNKLPLTTVIELFLAQINIVIGPSDAVKIYCCRSPSQSKYSIVVDANGSKELPDSTSYVEQQFEVSLGVGVFGGGKLHGPWKVEVVE